MERTDADRSSTALVFLVLTTVGVSIAACGDDSVSPVDDTVVDIDGNVYNVVRIGDQWWMSENLRTSTYRNGDAIPSGLDEVSWAHTESGAYAIHPHVGEPGVGSEAEMLEAYGALYNHYAVSDPRGLCPAGWRVPSDVDWMRLEIHLGMSEEEAEEVFERGTTEGGKLKATRTDPDPHPRWTAPNAGATDESGWSGLPGGYRSRNGEFGGLGGHAIWWSATGFHASELGSELDWDVAWMRHVSFNSGGVVRAASHQDSGYSVRCLTD